MQIESERLEGISLVEKNWASAHICEAKNATICHMVSCDTDSLNLTESSSLW